MSYLALKSGARKPYQDRPGPGGREMDPLKKFKTTVVNWNRLNSNNQTVILQQISGHCNCRVGPEILSGGYLYRDREYAGLMGFF
ncbi:MAG: hypothetical protein ACE5EB_09560 [Thermodesulfobacteriota bacterium]